MSESDSVQFWPFDALEKKAADAIKNSDAVKDIKKTATDSVRQAAETIVRQEAESAAMRGALKGMLIGGTVVIGVAWLLLRRK